MKRTPLNRKTRLQSGGGPKRKTRISNKQSAKARKKSAGFNEGRTGSEPCWAAMNLRAHFAEIGECHWRKNGATEGHHLAGRAVRPDLAGNHENRQHLCPAHHQWAGEHPDRAEELGMMDRTKYELVNRDPMAKVLRQLGDG